MNPRVNLRNIFILAVLILIITLVHLSHPFEKKKKHIRDIIREKIAAEQPKPPSTAHQLLFKPFRKTLRRVKFSIESTLFPPEKANATILILARESDLGDLVSTLKEFESRINQRFGYPYTILNDKPFSREFIRQIKDVVSTSTEFVTTQPESWEYPLWIDQKLARACRKFMQGRNIIYGGSESYRFMCRYFSGFFFRHPSVTKYEYYWRVEPGVRFYCNVEDDPFLFMKRENKVYGFNIQIREFMQTIPSLWRHTKDWATENVESGKSLMPFFLKNGEYSGCHFWSNFEIARVDLWNNARYVSYFEDLDRNGGFFYERWGDAPVSIPTSV